MTNQQAPNPIEQTIAKLKNAERKKDIWEIIRFSLIILFIVGPIRLFIAQPFIVSGSSMVPTFNNRDYLIIDQLSYHLHAPERGDVIVFRYPEDPSKFFIKRVIGLPNERITIVNGEVRIAQQESETYSILDQEFLTHKTVDSHPTVTLGDDEYFVMGDNRPASSDSRVWGKLPEKYIIGKAFVRLYPFQDIDYKPGAIIPTLTTQE